ncbi:MAG TPA: LysR family transcriptional regulator [Kofleriaceae bacterium]|nr:LysR family transcriptional regulator [Kofleriaceae bacterium]
MDWNDLRYLLAVHRHGSLARAAAALGVTKATVSRRVAALEEAVGTGLVERLPDGMTLTAAGVTAARAAEAIEATVARAADELSGGGDDAVAGTVRLTVAPWLAELLIIPAVARLRHLHPRLDLRLDGSHALVDVAAREADLALRNVRPTAGALVCARVGELAGCVYGSALYLERRGTPRDRDALAAHDLLVYEGRAGMPGFEWLAGPELAARVVFRAGDPAALTAAAASGLGLAAVPCILGETEPALRRVEALGVGFSPLYLVCREELRDAPRLRAVWQLVTELLRDNAAVLMGRGD